MAPLVSHAGSRGMGNPFLAGLMTNDL